MAAARMALLASALLAAACGGVAEDGATAAVEAQGDGDQAPDFTLPDVNGGTYALTEGRGKVQLIDFWATWCAPCREEIPFLKQLDETYRDQGLTIVAISDEDREVVSEFVEGEGLSYVNLLDSGDVAASYEVLALPTGFLIDREGRIVDRFYGPKPAKVLESRIRELLELPPAT